MRVQVTATGERAGDHNVFALYQGGWSSAPKSPGGRGLGRYFRPDELEVIPETP